MREQPKVAVTAEEEALIANRERLLARQDWLGLAATRPVRMKFPSDRERQRIGKRRKIHKSKPRHGHEVANHAIANPVEGWRAPFEPMMSGAIGNDEIQIKVGTDAFLSQTHRSRPSHNSVNTSIRPISTDFGPISEESMLLKADSDGFETRDEDRGVFPEGLEAFGSRFRERSREYFDAPCSDTAYPVAFQQTMRDVHLHHPPGFQDGIRDFSPGSIDDALLQQHKMPNRGEYPWAMAARELPDSDTMLEYNDAVDFEQPATAFMNLEDKVRTASGSEYPDHAYMSAPHELAAERLRLESRRESPVENGNSLNPEPSPNESNCSPHDDLVEGRQTYYQSPEGRPATEAPISDDPDEDEDERVWKGFMQVKQAVSSRISVAVLRSSSPHLTQSTTSAWPMAAKEAELDDDDSLEDMLDDWQDIGRCCLGAVPNHHRNARVFKADEFSNVIGPPTPSHLEILQPVNQTPLAEVVQQDDAEDELWRQFVVGSQSSQDHSSQGDVRMLRTKSSDGLLPAPAFPDGSASEQLRSDRMTTGGSAYAAAASDSRDDDLSSNRMNTSLIGHATTVNPERDATEGRESPRKRRHTTSIRAGAATDARPKRHYESRRRTKYAPLPRVLPRVLKKANTFAPPKSIYDLSVDSSN